MTTDRTTNGRRPDAFLLTEDQIEMIEEALAGVGDFGEVRLVVEKGRLRFIVTQKSMDALKWRAGAQARR